MPYQIQENDSGRFCIHKEMDDGEMGDAIVCFDTMAEAEGRMEEMMADEGMMSKGAPDPVEQALQDGLAAVTATQATAKPKSTAVAIKSETEDKLTIAGWGVIFGGEDLYWTRFSKDTDYWLDEGRLGSKKVALYDHGYNEAIKQTVIGQATITQEEDGLWVEAELEKHNRYVEQISKLLGAGVLGWSSGAIAHLIDGAEDADGVFAYRSWPIVEMSLTPTPAEPRTLGVAEIRGLVAHVEALRALLPEDSSEEDGSAQPGEVTKTSDRATIRIISEPSSEGQSTEVTDVDVNELAVQVTSLSTKTEQMSEMLEKVLKRFEDEPALRNAGFVSPDGGTADKNVRSFADFLVAIRRKDVKRLAEIYGSVRTLTEGDGTAGGYLVPEEMRTDLLQVAANTSKILPLVREIPVNGDAGSWPALDQYVAPTVGVGNTAFAGGVVATAKGEGAELDTTDPAFKEINWKVNKIGGITYVSNELASDSPLAVDALLRGLFGIAVAAKREFYVIRGSGAGEPLGILNSAAAIGVTTATNDTFAWVDALGMLARFKQITPNVRWVMHPGVLPDLGAAGWVTGNIARKIEDLGFGPFVTSEHMPQDDNDDVLLADFGTYLLFVRQALAIAYSEHAAFTSDRGVWRFTERLDGQPWMKGAITLADPQGSYTVSPYVYHND